MASISRPVLDAAGDIKGQLIADDIITASFPTGLPAYEIETQARYDHAYNYYDGGTQEQVNTWYANDVQWVYDAITGDDQAFARREVDLIYGLEKAIEDNNQTRPTVEVDGTVYDADALYALYHETWSS